MAHNDTAHSICSKTNKQTNNERRHNVTLSAAELASSAVDDVTLSCPVLSCTQQSSSHSVILHSRTVNVPFSPSVVSTVRLHHAIQSLPLQLHYMCTIWRNLTLILIPTPTLTLNYKCLPSLGAGPSSISCFHHGGGMTEQWQNQGGIHCFTTAEVRRSSGRTDHCQWWNAPFHHG